MLKPRTTHQRHQQVGDESATCLTGTNGDADPMALNPPLLALAVGAFGIGVTEFTPMGMLPLIAADLNVSIPAAGLVVSAYALGVVIGAPLVTLATARLPRRRLLVGPDLWPRGADVPRDDG